MTHATPRPTAASRIAREYTTIAAMIRVYCRAHHRTEAAPCEACRQLLDYADRRLDTCPFQEDKPVCNKCTVHCYSKGMRERVRAVMRFSGPRMLYRHPWLALRHLLDTRRPAPELQRSRTSKKPAQTPAGLAGSNTRDDGASPQAPRRAP